MGYTHYYTGLRNLTEEERDNLSESIVHIVEATKVPLAGWDGANKLAFDDEGRVHFNGVGADGHETFSFPTGDGFNFCKTASKPYDEVVTAILIAADTICPGAFDISSDGNIEDWVNGLALAGFALDRTDLKVPSGVRD